MELITGLSILRYRYGQPVMDLKHRALIEHPIHHIPAII